MYLGIDLWDKNCGVAVCIDWIIIPKAIISRPNLVNNLKKLQKLYNITTMVVWLPYDLYNRDDKQLKKTQKFIEKLKSIFPDLLIEWFDERFSSFEAEQVLAQMGVDKQTAIWQKDSIAASIILESYLQSKWLYK